MFSKYDEIRARRARGDKGFTLIELLVVVVIIGILIAIAIPVYLNYQKGAHNKAAESDVRNAISTMEQCASDSATGAYPTGATLTASGTLTGCSQKFVVSADVSLKIENTGTSSETYKITGTSSSGGKAYTYDSSVGGPVTLVTP